jgi:hypothetical protein
MDVRGDSRARQAFIRDVIGQHMRGGSYVKAMPCRST